MLMNTNTKKNKFKAEEKPMTFTKNSLGFKTCCMS